MLLRVVDGRLFNVYFGWCMCAARVIRPRTFRYYVRKFVQAHEINTRSRGTRVLVQTQSQAEQ